jgi:hypothetical protein
MKTDIEYAALVMGWAFVGMATAGNRNAFIVNTGDNPSMLWNPNGDDGDSRRLEAACWRWYASASNADQEKLDFAFCTLTDAKCRSDLPEPEHLQAIRDAVLALAVAIGKVIAGESLCAECGMPPKQTTGPYCMTCNRVNGGGQ